MLTKSCFACPVPALFLAITFALRRWSVRLDSWSCALLPTWRACASAHLPADHPRVPHVGASALLHCLLSWAVLYIPNQWVISRKYRLHQTQVTHIVIELISSILIIS
ncbi:hypothetical protein V8F20_009330 [Naviculisporaceae sp. PSN 640]